MHDLKNTLNPSQLAAVNATTGPILVIAGAGSGKTRVIEYRVLNLVKSGVDPKSILLLTFTKRAAHEMLSRAARHDPRIRAVDGGTFHSFAFKTLKKYSAVLGFSNLFSILDESDAEEAVHKCGARSNFFDKEKKHPKKSTLKAIFSVSVNKGRSIEETLDREYPHFLHASGEIEALRKEYAAYKIKKNYLDYDDLLIYLRLLLGKPEVRDRIAERYRYVMVDEYQDTNIIQGDIAFLLAEKHRNIMVVGDDAQSIYGFRGAFHRNIMEFPKRFDGCVIIKLEKNYRSTPPILDVANTVLGNMAHKYSKCLVSARGEEAAALPKLNFFKDGYDEAGWIAEKVAQLRAEGVELSQQAVLFRAAYVSIPLQAELARCGIPYQVFGGLKFYETAHVKDTIAHLKIIHNIKDEISWHRILTLIEGVGPKTADAISEAIMKEPSIAGVAARAFSEAACGARMTQSLKRLKSFLLSASRDGMSPGALYDLAFDYYLPLMKDKFDDWHLRLNDLEALRQIAARYVSLEELLGDFSIEPPDRSVLGVSASSKGDERPITLSTIHSAKGLEWDTVFLIGLVDGVLPSAFALGNDEDIEEEHRLFYVAITRAKNRLFMSLNHEGTRGGITQFNKISQFLETSNVLACLDQKVVFEGKTYDGIELDDSDAIDIEPAYDKDTLLKDVVDYIERRR